MNWSQLPFVFASKLPLGLCTRRFAKNLDHDRHGDEEAVRDDQDQVQEQKGESPQPTLHNEAEDEDGDNQHQVQARPCRGHRR